MMDCSGPASPMSPDNTCSSGWHIQVCEWHAPNLVLKTNLKNGPSHCFGHHSNCSPDFCSSARDRLQHHHLVQEVQTPVATATADDDAGATDDQVACELDLYK